MSVGDLGADEYGNVTRLSVAQQQYQINLAYSLGASRADVDAFIHSNGVNDLGRIVSALGLSTSTARSTQPGPGTGTTSYSAAVEARDPYTVPTPITNGGDLAQSSPSDGRITGSLVAASGGAAAAPNVNVSVTSPPTATGAVAVLPSSGIPTWALVLGALALVFVFMERR